jgi:hypothetical protein
MCRVLLCWADSGPRSEFGCMRCSNCAALRVVRPCVEVLVRIMPFAKVVGAGFIVSACASSHASYDGSANVGVQPAKQVAVVAPPKIELEDDGLAVQTPPRSRRHTEPDDPSEPFSPNYGPRLHRSEPVAAPQRPTHQATVAGPQFRSRTTPMSPAEARSIMARAMVEHERRYP